MYRRILGWFIPPEYLDLEQQRKDIHAAIAKRCRECSTMLHEHYPDDLCPSCFIFMFYDSHFDTTKPQDIPF